MTRGLFHNVFLEHELFVDTVLEVNVGIVDSTGQAATEQTLHQGRRDVEAVGEEAIGTDVSEVVHESRRAPI